MPRTATFYRAEHYFKEPSVGLLMKQVLNSIVLQVDQRLDVHGLTSTQWAPLLRLAKSGPSTVLELARWVQVDPAAMTRLLDRLEKKQLCRRSRDAHDRRVVRVEITPVGETAIAGVPAALSDVMNAHLAGFSRDEFKALTGALQRMLTNGEALRTPT
jgi:DNA-binding MarR family transcriptional regulator